jgi:preprotein translocase subunit SecE
MGRILRKKPASLKKKRKPDAETTADDAGRAAGAPSVAAGGEKPAVDAKQKAPAALKKPQAQSAPAPSGPAADNFLSRSVQFLREVKIELKKVTWPTRQQTLGSTLVVLVLVMVISLFLGVVDLGLSTLVRAVFN